MQHLNGERDWEDIDEQFKSFGGRETKRGSGVNLRKRFWRRGMSGPYSSPCPELASAPEPSVPKTWYGTSATAAWFMAHYIWEIIYIALQLLRRPLALFLVGYLLILTGSYIYTTLEFPLSTLLNPFCTLPLAARLTICSSQSNPPAAGGASGTASHPKFVDVQATAFEELLGSSASNVKLGLDIKRAEVAMNDLASRLRSSQLQTRDRMIENLVEFGIASKKARRGLQLFDSHVGGAADRVIALNDYVLRRIESDIISKTHDQRLWSKFLSPFLGQRLQPALLSATPLFALYEQMMKALDSELQVLISAAESAVYSLDKLEELLQDFQDISWQEKAVILWNKDTLVAHLWTKLGGNRKELRRYDSNLELLRTSTENRLRALAHVVNTLQVLEGIAADLTALRERAVQPVLPEEQVIMLDVHIKSIRSGLERLTAHRMKWKKGEDARYSLQAASL